jgi:hypothetical protein
MHQRQDWEFQTQVQCTCKAAANRFNVYVSGKNNKILPIPETMLGISTSAESKEERSKKKKSLVEPNEP